MGIKKIIKSVLCEFLTENVDNNIRSKYGFDYMKNVSEKGNIYYNIGYNGNKIGLIEFHKIDNNYIEIDRIYLDKNQQKQGLGPKIIYDILTYTKSDGFILYPLESSIWIKMGLGFIDGRYPYMNISKKEFINTNKL